MFLFYFDITWGTRLATLNAGEDSWVGVWAGRSQLGKSLRLVYKRAWVGWDSRLMRRSPWWLHFSLFWQRTHTLNMLAIGMKEEFILCNTTGLYFCSSSSHGNHTRRLVTLFGSKLHSWPDTKDGSFWSRFDVNQWLRNGKHLILFQKLIWAIKILLYFLPKRKGSGADKGVLVVWSKKSSVQVMTSSLLLQCFSGAVPSHALSSQI